MKAEIATFKRFLRTHSISQHMAAERLQLSQSSISKLLQGRDDHLKPRQREYVLNMMVAWMDNYAEREHAIYVAMIPIVRAEPLSVVRSAMNNVIRDLAHR